MKKPLILLLIPLVLAVTGCTNSKHYVVAATSTIIGVEVAQNPSSQMMEAKLGYNRSELALVPSNRSSGKDGDVAAGGGAADTTDVVMELNYGNIFSLSSSSIYQRLAVGKNAVSQPGAAFMFAKGKDGTLDPKIAESVSRAIGTVPLSNPDVTALKVPLATAYSQSVDKARFDAAAKAAGFKDFETFLTDTQATAAQVEAVQKGLQ
jgi:hypothetical protein